MTVHRTPTEREEIRLTVTAYSFEADHRPIGQLIRALKGKSEKLYELSEDLLKVPNASARQETFEKNLALKDLAPGQYIIRLKIPDPNRNQVVTTSCPTYRKLMFSSTGCVTRVERQGNT